MTVYPADIELRDDTDQRANGRVQIKIRIIPILQLCFMVIPSQSIKISLSKNPPVSSRVTPAYKHTNKHVEIIHITDFGGLMTQLLTWP